MKKLYFIISLIISVIGGKTLALVLFDTPRDPGGAAMAAAGFLLIFAVFGVIYQILHSRYKEAAMTRLARYERRKALRFEEIDAKNYIRNYELLRASFLEGRKEQ